VNVQPRPAPSITGSPAFCHGDAAVFTAVNSSPLNQYQWNVTGGQPTGGQNSPTLNVTWSASGMMTLTLTETTPAGCDSTVSRTILVSPLPAPVLNGTPVICESLSSVYAVQQNPGSQYEWSVSGGTIIRYISANQAEVSWFSGGNGSIGVTETSAAGCQSTVSMPVTIASKPEARVTGLNGCAPLRVSFNDNIAQNNFFRWNFGDGGTSVSAAPVHTFSSPGQYEVEVQVISDQGCRDSARATVRVYPSPTAEFSTNQNEEVYYSGWSRLQLINSSTGALAYQWSFGDEFEPVHEYAAAGVYTITLVTTNQFLCRDTATYILEVKMPEDIYIPNSFTPNGDGINDYFTAVYNNIVELEVDIFNRWGEIIYSSRSLEFMWDGNCKGRPVEEAVYVYRLVARGVHGKELVKIGMLTVVR
jgi:gliding motility-associated-like protein